MFSEAEQRFLRKEHATVGLRDMIDVRQIGCPEAIYNKILERRAKKLGSNFVRDQVEHVVVSDDLDARIQASKLF